MRAALALAALLMVPTWGCSAFITRPPEALPQRGEPLDCTADDDLPRADVVGTIFFGAGAVLLTAVSIHAASSGSTGGEGDPPGGVVAGIVGAVAVVTALIAGGYALSARSGFAATRRCRELRQQRERGQVGPPRAGSACGAIFDRTSCGPGLLCVEHRCLPVAPRDGR